MDYDEALETVSDARVSVQFLIEDLEHVEKEMGFGAGDIVSKLHGVIEECLKCEERLEDAKAEYEEEKRNEVDEDAIYEAWKDRRAEEE